MNERDEIRPSPETQWPQAEKPLLVIEPLREKLGLPNFFVKDESSHPTGTWKDRRSSLIVEQALTAGIKTLCLITSGNAGYSLAMAAANRGLEVVSVVDHALNPSIRAKLASACRRIVDTRLDDHVLAQEEILSLAGTNNKVAWEVTSGYEAAYGAIVDEVAATTIPHHLVVPIGSGEAFVGMARRISELQLPTRLIGVAAMENPSFADKLARAYTPYQAEIDALTTVGHRVVALSEPEIHGAYDLARNLFRCEPSASAVAGGIRKVQDQLNPTDIVVAVNSGRGLQA